MPSGETVPFRQRVRGPSRTVYRKVVAKAPALLETGMPVTTNPRFKTAAEAVREITNAVVASDYVRAALLAQAAGSSGVIHPMIQIAHALWLESQGRDADALASYNQARTLSPGDVRIITSIGLCLARLYRFDEAARAFDEAIRLEPRTASSQQRKGMVLGLAGRLDEAARAYERACKLEPRNVETLTSLASLAVRKGDKTKARDYAERALAVDMHNANAHVALAQVELGDGDCRSAAERLRKVAKDPSIVGQARSVMLGLLGDALDNDETAREAFAAYSAANAERLNLHRQRFQGQKRAREILDDVIAAFAEIPTERWHGPPVPVSPRVTPSCHVFLLGFPRSGTTVLEQALESHPDVTTMDERDFLPDIAERYLMSAAGVETLSRLDEATLAAHRATYWQRVDALGLKLAGRVFVDKQPFHTIKLPLIARLFPEAKIIFSLRDPRDVVLSCFRRQLEVDLLRVEFLTLEGAAGIYDRFMRLADLCREKLPLPFFDCRYEELIADFDTATRDVCGWLGIPWRESMRDIAATAHRLDANKASTSQVRRGLYRGGMGQWERYREELGPVLPRLEPWIERFGYPAT